MNSRNFLGIDYISQLAQLLVLVSLPLRLIDHQPLDPSHSPARSFFFVSTECFLSVRNFPHFEHLDVVVSEMEYDDPLDVGEVKL